MASIGNIRKKRGRGRPPVGATPIMVRMPPAELDKLDAWIKRQDKVPSRPEAIRRLVELGIANKASSRPVVGRPDASARASRRAQAEKIAAEQIDRVLKKIDQPEEVKAKRKRRLTKGPAEFRKR